MLNIKNQCVRLAVKAGNAFIEGDAKTATARIEQMKPIHESLPASERGYVDDQIWKICDALPGDQQMELVEMFFGSVTGEREKPQSPGKKGTLSASILAELADLNYDFRMDKTDDSIEVNGERLTDAIRATIRMEMRDRNFKGMAALEDTWTAEAYRNVYHPIHEYLESLSYNGDQNIQLLARHFIETYGVAYDWLKVWLVGAVSKAYAQGQNPMLVLSGPQNIGKSFFAKWLCSPLPARFIESAIDPENKDYQLALIRKWIWEVGELGSTIRKADREALKFFITNETVTVRKPYGKTDIVKPALASFIGTINNECGFLTDTTGNRRFLTLDLQSILWTYSKKIDVNQIWAEAYQAYKSGDRGTLQKEQMILSSNINKAFEIEEPIEDLLKNHFELDPDQSDWFMPTNEIVSTLEDNGLHGSSRKGHQMMIYATLKKLGHQKAPGDRLRGWLGIRKPPIDSIPF